jgi:hypothetical protein
MIGWEFLCVVFQKKINKFFFWKVGHWAPIFVSPRSPKIVIGRILRVFDIDGTGGSLIPEILE